LAATSFFRWGHWGTRSFDASTKYGTTAMLSQSQATGGGDEEDSGATSGVEDRGGR
jgi:hypothetical protein